MENFDVLFYSSPQPMWVFDVNTLYIIEVNNAAIKRYGYSRKEFLNRTIMDLRLPEDIPMIVKVLPDIRGTKTRYREFKHIAKSGRILNVEIMSYPFLYKSTNSRLVIAQNIDEKKAILGKLDFTEFKLEQILEETKIGFFQMDYGSRITYWNKAAENLIGYKMKYVKGKNLWDVFPEIKGSDFYNYYEQAARRRERVDFTDYFWPVQKWFSVDIYPTADGVIVNFIDVTSQKRAEEKLLEKIDQLSEVSFLNSHYLRKPVASLLGLTTLLDETTLTAAELSETVQYIKACATELDEVLRKINSTVNYNEDLEDLEQEAENFSLNELITNVVCKDFQLQQTHRIIRKKKTDFTYYGNKKSIAAAIKSMLSNAIKFSPGAGKVVIDTQVIDNNLVISVKDFGKGIDEQLLNKIFISFIKRDVARELGLGLLKITDAANKHNGSVWLESQPGAGTLFSMRLPLSNIAQLKSKKRLNPSVFKNDGIEVEYNKAGGYIVADWKGFHSLHTIKTGCLKILEALVAYKCSKILNNNTKVLGTWENAVEWVTTEWFPLAEDAGLKHISWVYSPSTFSRLSADHTIDRSTGGITHKTFKELAGASEWLMSLSKPLAYNPE